jgi:hypothetical protein
VCLSLRLQHLELSQKYCSTCEGRGLGWAAAAAAAAAGLAAAAAGAAPALCEAQGPAPDDPAAAIRAALEELWSQLDEQLHRLEASQPHSAPLPR